MISQILPHLLPTTLMVRVSESGIYTESGSTNIEATKSDPLSGMYPEAFELSLVDDIPLELILGMLGFACIKHKALLEVRSRSSKPMYSAVVSIMTGRESFQAVLVLRNKRVLFIMPTPSH